MIVLGTEYMQKTNLRLALLVWVSIVHSGTSMAAKTDHRKMVSVDFCCPELAA